MRHTIFIFSVLTALFLTTSIVLSQTKQTAFKAKAVVTLYEYDRYDENGNTCLSVEAPTNELRYDCPVCKGARALNIQRTGVPVNVKCWRCNGKGYLISNSGN